jgi:hypothetical protein
MARHTTGIRYAEAIAALDEADREQMRSRWGRGGTIYAPLRNADPADAFEHIFGDRRETPARARFLLVCIELGDLEEAGWNGPRRMANNRIDTLDSTTDYHVWCIDKEDEDRIMDYPDNQLAPFCPRRTNRLVRQAWPRELDEGIRPRLEVESQLRIELLINEWGSREALMTAIQNNNFPLQHCLCRAYLIHNSNPSRYEVVIGAFGFIQSDGRTWWESG